jgi:hypothetical protein
MVNLVSQMVQASIEGEVARTTCVPVGQTDLLDAEVVVPAFFPIDRLGYLFDNDRIPQHNDCVAADQQGIGFLKRILRTD